jgi:RNA polymerase sigma-70 factor (ECF subfamily)
MAHRSPEELEAERLLIEAAQRDRAAFAPLYERYVEQIFAYAHTLTRNREVAEDVTASTFAKAIEDLPRFEWRGIPYSAWLYRVASNLVARQARRPAWSDLDAHQPVDEASPELIVEQRSREAEVRAAVAKLPEDQRQAVLLRFGGDLRNREIAEIMERSEGAVKLLTFRAMTSLRKQLGAPLPAERSMEGRQ